MYRKCTDFRNIYSQFTSKGISHFITEIMLNIDKNNKKVNVIKRLNFKLLGDKQYFVQCFKYFKFPCARFVVKTSHKLSNGNIGYQVKIRSLLIVTHNTKAWWEWVLGGGGKVLRRIMAPRRGKIQINMIFASCKYRSSSIDADQYNAKLTCNIKSMKR